MRFVRSIPKIGGLPELQTSECRACGVSITEAFEPKVLEMVAIEEIANSKNKAAGLDNRRLCHVPQSVPCSFWMTASSGCRSRQ
jgi:hypothetical protein